MDCHEVKATKRSEPPSSYVNDYTKERLEMMVKVSIEALADRDKLIESLCNCILSLQRDSMR